MSTSATLATLTNALKNNIRKHIYSRAEAVADTVKAVELLSYPTDDLTAMGPLKVYLLKEDEDCLISFDFDPITKIVTVNNIASNLDDSPFVFKIFDNDDTANTRSLFVQSTHVGATGSYLTGLMTMVVETNQTVGIELLLAVEAVPETAENLTMRGFQK